MTIAMAIIFYTRNQQVLRRLFDIEGAKIFKKGQF